MGLPESGRDREALLDEMQRRRHGDTDWESGRTWSLVYSAGADVESLRDEAYVEFADENALNPLAFPSILSFENDVVGMVADMMHAPDAVGNVTSGGTESIICAVYAARERAREVAGITDPAMVVPETAHPAWDKAGHYLGVESIRTATDDGWRADPAAIREALSERTALVVASAPSYPHGVIDPIEPIAELAAERDIPCHVDACIGGFVLPFLPATGRAVPPFDFRVDGVTSMSVDPHKYGYTAKGVSTILYRDRELRRHQYYAFDGWPGGIYAAPNVQGTRPAGPIAAAWAIMQFLGRDGYTALVGDTMDATEAIAAFVADHEDLGIVGDPDMSLLAIESRTPAVSGWTVQRELADRDWEIERIQEPRGMHLSVMAQHAPVVEEFLSDLEVAVDEARATTAEAEATAPLYGLSGTLDETEEVTEAVRDLLNQVFV